jgi:chromosome segregation ATPase
MKSRKIWRGALTSSNATLGKSRANTYIAIALGIIAFGLVGFLLFRVGQMEKSFGYLRDNKVSIEQQIANAQDSHDSIAGRVSKLEGQRNGLRVEIAGLKADKDRHATLTDYINEAVQQLSELQGDYRNAQNVISEMDDAEDLRDSARREKEKIKDEIGDLKRQRSQLEDDVSKATSRATEAKRDAGGLERENANLKSQKREFEKEVADLGRRKGELKVVSRTLDKKKTQVLELKADENGLKTQVDAADSDLGRLQEDIRRAKKKLEQIEKEATKKQIDFTKLELQISQQNGLLGKLATAQVSLKVIESRLASDKAKLKAAENDRRAAEGLARASKAEDKNLQVSLTNERADLSRFTAEKEAQEQKLKLANQALIETNSEISGLTQTKTRLTKQYEKLLGDIKAESNTLLRVKNELARARTDRASFETDEDKARELTARNFVRKGKLDELVEDLAKQKTVLETERGKLTAAIRGADIARKEKQDALAAVKRLIKDKGTLDRELAKQTVQKGQISETIKSLKQKSKDEGKLLERLQGQLLKTETSLRTQSTKLRRAKSELEEVNTILGEMNGRKSIAQTDLTETRRSLGKAKIDLKSTQDALTAALIKLGAAKKQNKTPALAQEKASKK